MDFLDFRFGQFLIPIVAIIAGCTVAIVKTIARSRVHELQIRERIALIERGLVPPPEVDPRGFDGAFERYDRQRSPGRRGSGRHRQVGVIFMGVGFGLMLLVSVSGDNPREGIGLGSFFVVLGLAFFINSLFESPHQESSVPTGSGAPPAAPTSTAPRSDPH